MSYILEIGYNKCYEKSKKEHIRMMRDYIAPEKFTNTWKDSMKNMSRLIVTYTMTGAIFPVSVAYDIINIPKRLLKIKINNHNNPDVMIKKLNFFYNHSLFIVISEALIKHIIGSILINYAIPISPPTKLSEGILFIPNKNNEKYKVDEKNNNSKPSSQNVKFNIKAEEFNPLLISIAQTYSGKLIEQKSEKEKNILYFAFEANAAVERLIKRFLYSLPPNVFLRFVYRIDKPINYKNSENNRIYHNYKNAENTKNTNNTINTKNTKNANNNERKIDSLQHHIIFPRSTSDLSDDELTKIDEQVIKYFQVHTKLYNKYNDNINYIVDRIKPLRFFLPILPESMHPPKWSPMK